jgi:hypothetical protein
VAAQALRPQPAPQPAAASQTANGVTRNTAAAARAASFRTRRARSASSAPAAASTAAAAPEATSARLFSFKRCREDAARGALITLCADTLSWLSEVEAEALRSERAVARDAADMRASRRARHAHTAERTGRIQRTIEEGGEGPEPLEGAVEEEAAATVAAGAVVVGAAVLVAVGVAVGASGVRVRVSPNPNQWLALAEAAEAEAAAACTPSDRCKCEVGWAVEVRGEHVHGSFLGAVEARRAMLAAQLEALEAGAAAEAAAEAEEAQAVLHETAAQRTLGRELGQQHCALRARASDVLREAAALRLEAAERQAKAAAITVPLAALRVEMLPLLPQLHSREHGVADQLAEVEGCWLECRQLMQQLHWRVAARRRRVARESRWCEAESERLQQQLASQACMHAAPASCT